LTARLVEKLNLFRCDKIETRQTLLEKHNALPQSSDFVRADSDLVRVNRADEDLRPAKCRAHLGSELLWLGASLGTHCRYLPPFAGADFAR
jgi:hypothetical protein